MSTTLLNSRRHVSALQLLAKRISDSYGRVLYIGDKDPILSYYSYPHALKVTISYHLSKTPTADVEISYTNHSLYGFVLKGVRIGDTDIFISDDNGDRAAINSMDDISSYLGAIVSSIQADLEKVGKLVDVFVDGCYVIRDEDRSELLASIHREILHLMASMHNEMAMASI